ncbi:MipA/OmpV family protein [Rhodanobacter sp. PCA2]|uniref:MipA/OmpV family protein n=1 Tax=Rhodanobacter sp. PCA2 TaxID=2006117 RepID=UPI0015E6CF50|nr:MipA/OmpV family protein [Rhodanobacter sp. PCA2]MBA2078931.1 structural protein MipA [Rhodanobacter sp. PCA2]
MPAARSRLLIALLCLSLPLCAAADDTDPAPTLAIGAGVQRMPRWAGAHTHRNDPIPFVDIELPQYGFSLSTEDGLQWDLIRDTRLHGGIYGDFQWGRDRDDLGASLAGKLPTLAPRATGGGYLEWEFNPQLDAGLRLSHDLNGAGAYLEFYAEWDPPKLGLLEQSLQLRWQSMNGAAMRRFFGVAPASATALGVPAWQPGGGSQLAALAYNLFLPTGKHTGLAASLEYGYLLGDAAASPLVRQYGSRNQFTESLAFVYHF